MLAAVLLPAAAAVPFLAQALRRTRNGAHDGEAPIAVDALPDNLAVWQWDAASRDFRATQLFGQLFGLRPDEPLPTDAVLERIHPDDRPGFERLFATHDGAGVLDFSFRVLVPEEEPRWIVGKAHIWRDTHGRPARASGVIVDATERKRAESEVEHHRQQLAHLARVAILGELSSALAHELNQPLSSILSNAQAAQNFLAKDPVDLQEVRAIVEDIANDDRRAAEVIRRLRDMLRRGNTQMQQLELAEVALDVIALLQSDLVRKHVKVSLKLDPKLAPVCGDRVQLQQVLLNLFLNAADAMSETKESERVIELAASNDDDHVHLRVIDRGRGIPPEKLEAVFESFYTTKSHGLGLGLAISRSIVAAHQGQLWATNNDRGGACFHLTLPTATLTRAPRASLQL